MAFINASPIQTTELLLNNNNTLGKIYTLNDNVYFKNSTDTEFKLNTPIEPIYIDNNNIGIDTTTPNSKLDIFSESTQLQLSYSNNIWSKFKVTSSNSLLITGQTCIDINNSNLINLNTPVNDNDAVNKKYVDDTLGCISGNTSDGILNDLCTIYNFSPSASISDADIAEQISLRAQFKIPLQLLVFAVTSEFHPICVKTGALTFRIPSNIFITEIRASLTKVAVGCTGVKFNIEQSESHCNLLVNDFYIPSGHKTETIKYDTTNNLFHVNQLVDNEELIVNITHVGDIYSGSGLKIILIGI